MPADGLHDLTDRLNVRDAVADYLRAELNGSDVAMAAWARAWGRPVVEALPDLVDNQPDGRLDANDVAQARAELIAAIGNTVEGALAAGSSIEALASALTVILKPQLEPAS